MKDQLAIASARAVDVLPDAARGFLPSVNGVETLDVLRRRWRLITCLVAASGALTYLLGSACSPVDAAKTAVMIDTRGPSPAASRTNQIAMPPSEETLRKNEIAVIRSRSLAEAVVTRLSLDQDPEFNPSVRSTPARRDLLAQMHSVLTSLRSMLSGPPEGKTFGSPGEEARDKAVETLLERLNTTSTDASRVIEIRILSEDPERAARISNTIADQYISAKIEQQIAGPQSVAQSLERNIEALNQKIRDSERNIEEKRAERGLLSNANARVAVEQLAELNKQLAAATRERVAAEARLRELQSPNGSSGAASASSVLGSPLIQRLQAEATLLVARI